MSEQTGREDLLIKETISANETAEILNLSAWSVYELAKRKIIPHIRCGRRVLFRRSTILDWLGEQERKSVSVEPVPSFGKLRRIQ